VSRDVTSPNAKTGALARNEEAVDAFERETALPMLVLALLAVPVLLIPLWVDLPRGIAETFLVLDWVIWVAFAVEYLIRLYLVPHKAVFVKHNLLDLAVVVLPFLRPFRVIRSARALRLLRAGRVTVYLTRGASSAKDVLTRHGLHYALLVGAVLVLTAALIVSELERTAPGATIHSFGDAIWWALATMSTVGFGDKYPVTEAGRAVAVVLMFFGIGIFGLLAASLASFFIGKKREERVDPVVAEISERLQRIEEMLRVRTVGEIDGAKDQERQSKGEPT
jgi:voltage-gated potassium channel